MIISELQGGENDPDQLLDQEVTATAFKAHPYRHPTIGWLDDLQIDDARRSLRPLPPVLRPEQRDAGRRRRRRRRRRASAGRSSTSARSRQAVPPRAAARVEPEQIGERRVRHRARGHDRLPEAGVSRAGGDGPRLLSAARARRGADRREGREPVVEFSRRAAAAQGASLHARSSRAGWRRSSAARCCRPREPFLYTLSLTAIEGVPLGRRSRPRRSTRSIACDATGITDGGADAGASVSSGRGWCSRTTASRTSRTSSATSRPSRARSSVDAAAGGSMRSRSSRSADVARRRLDPASADDRRGSDPSPGRQPDPTCRPGERAMTPPPAAACSPLRHALDNGAVVIVQETASTPAVTINAAFRAGSLLRAGATCPGWRTCRARDRSRHRATHPRTSSPKSSTSAECRCGSAARVTDDVLVHLPVRRLRRRPRDLSWTWSRRPVASPDEELAKRRAEVVTAIRQDDDNPGVRAVEALFELLYGAAHPYGRTAKGTIGEPRTPRPRCRLPAFHRRYVAPAALSLVDRRGRGCRRSPAMARSRGARRLAQRRGRP